MYSKIFIRQLAPLGPRVYTDYMRRRAFTILEVIISVAIIAVLALLVTLSMFRVRANSKLARVTTELDDISQSVALYAQDHNYTYPPDTNRAVPPGLTPYLANGVWPTSVWPHGVFDWDNIIHHGGDLSNPSDPNNAFLGQQIYQISYRLCDTVNRSDDPSWCSDPILFPHFTQYSSIYYCVAGPCVPHEFHITDPGYCVNCKPKEVNPPV